MKSYKKKISIFGAGFVGQSLSTALRSDCEVRLFSENNSADSNIYKVKYPDLKRSESFQFIQESELIVLTIGSGNLDIAETYPDEARNEHIDRLLALLVQLDGVKSKLIYVSTDKVFEGNDINAESPKVFSVLDIPNPTTVYGQLKREAEVIIEELPHATILRVPLLVSTIRSDKNPLFKAFAALKNGTDKKIHLDNTQLRYPTFIEDIAEYLRTREVFPKIVHFSSQKALTRFAMYKHLAELLDSKALVLNDGIYPDVSSGLIPAKRTQTKLLTSVDFDYTDIMNFKSAAELGKIFVDI